MPVKAGGGKRKVSCCWNVENVQLLGRSQTYHLAINQYNKSLTSQCPLNVNLRIDWIAGWQEGGAVG